jgi:hypothetical protein
MTLIDQVATVLHGAGIAHALVGAVALSIHGVNRATHDLDLFVVDRSCLRRDFWTDLEGRGVFVEVRKGDLTDPLAGVVRFKLQGESSVDVVVGKFKWQRDVLDRAILFPAETDIPVVRAADLILLKLHAAGPQDAWDIQQLLDGEDRDELIVEVEKLLPELSADAAKLWRRILEG